MHEPVPKTARDTLNANIKKHPSSGNQVHNAQSVVERIAATTNAKCLANATRNKVAQHAKSCRVDAFDDLRQTRPHDCLAITRCAVKFFVRSGLHDTLFHKVVNGAFCNMAMTPVLVVLWPASFWRLYELARMFEITITEGRIHRDDLALPHVPHNTRLRYCVALNRHDYIDVHHFTWSGVTEVLSSGPDDVSAGCAFHGRDGCSEGATAVQKVPASA